jgi:uncharacterized C2H2 Zn-finger protein
MTKKRECDTGIEYGCPYIGKCGKGGFYHISNDNLSSLTNPEHLWYFAKRNLTKTSKIWFNKNSKGETVLYICQPCVKYQTFYESEKNKLIFKIKKTLLAFINKSNTELKDKIKNIEEELKENGNN